MVDNFLLEKLCCINCGGNLKKVELGLGCEQCSASFKVKDGIAIFYDEE